VKLAEIVSDAERSLWETAADARAARQFGPTRSDIRRPEQPSNAPAQHVVDALESSVLSKIPAYEYFN